MDDIIFIGDWIKDRVLGSGSFGVVVLWKHKRTDEKLAIKTCKWGDELTSKHKERWTKEVEMLESCRHPNIVGTKELPPEFVIGLQRANPSGLPILCMEYCSGGDLRQILNKPESCAGLKEPQVRQILSDLGNAMRFLHQNRITHRDLKPENIVMYINDSPGVVTPQKQANVIYKLIDLGYAKEIDSNSICASFVGTLQYLAPEILYSKTYSNSVDYWSLGLLAFEIICGKRPFLPFMAPVQWMPHVKKKLHSNICVHESFHGDIEYSDEIFPENHISAPFKSLIEDWLRIALEWDPKLRGKAAPSRVTFNIPEEEKIRATNVVIFERLDSILKMKIINIFSIATYEKLAYVIEDTTTVATLMSWITRDKRLSANNQLLISQTNYVVLGRDELVVRYWSESNDCALFLFSRSQTIAENLETVVPKSVQRCMEHSKAMYNFKNSSNLYQNGLYFVMTQMELFDLLIKGLIARGESLKYEGNQLHLKHNSVDKNIGNLLAQEEIMKKIVESGQDHLNGLNGSLKESKQLVGFGKLFKEYDTLSDKISKLKSAWSKVTERLKSASKRCNEPISVELQTFISKNNYQTVYTSAYKSYLIHKRTINENKGQEKKCPDITKASYDCLKIRMGILTKIGKEPFFFKLMDLGTEFAKIDGIVKNASEHNEKLSVNLMNMLEQINSWTWTTIKSSLERNASQTENDQKKNDFKIGETVSTHYFKTINIDEGEPLRSIVEDSLKIRKDHKYLTQKLNMQRELLSKSIFDFSFLEDK